MESADDETPEEDQPQEMDVGNLLLLRAVMYCALYVTCLQLHMLKLLCCYR